MATYNNAADYQATQYNVLTGGATNLINNVAPSATSGVPVISQGSSSQPVFGTAVVAGGGTGVTTMTTAYAPICAGTTATGALQVASTGLSTSGYVLTSNGASALPSFKAISAGGGILQASVVLTSAQVQALVTTPITIVAAQGAGTFINPIYAVAKLYYGGNNPFIYNGSGSVGISTSNTSTLLINVLSGATIGSSATNYSALAGSFSDIGNTLLENSNLIIRNTSSSNITGNAAGNNTITFVVWYAVISI